MGWSRGSNLMHCIQVSLVGNTSKEQRESIYEELIPIFENFDCDTLQECLGFDSAFDRVYNNMYPEDE